MSFNTDQGSQFTCDDFTRVLLDRSIQISMDGRGRYLDNIFVERLWRTVKVEEVYLRDYDTVTEAVYYLGRYLNFIIMKGYMNHWGTKPQPRCTLGLWLLQSPYGLLPEPKPQSR